MVINESVEYIAMSTLEAFCSIYFIMLIFRIKLSEFWKEILMSIFILSLSNYYFENSELLSKITPLLTMLLFFLIFCLIFRISMIHSFFMTAFGFFACFLIQGVIIFSIGSAVSLSLSDIKNNDLLRSVFQIISALTYLIIGKYCSKKGYVFTFIPYEPSFKFKINKKNAAVIFSWFIGLLMIAFVFELGSVVTGIGLVGSLFIIFLSMGIRREVSKFD